MKATTCKHCKKPIAYVASLQRWNHVDNNYDSCPWTIHPGKRAEP